MPKKQKKTVNKKPLKKSKNVVNVKINIDNSKKTTGRRVAATSKAPSQQPFANFPSYQPTRIQQLEPKQQFNNADLTKTIDEIYQKQFKVYMETQDKELKKLIEDNDDSLKKNIAPPTKDRSMPGAFNTFTDNKGNVILQEPVKPPAKSDTWNNPNEFKRNPMSKTEAEPLSGNKLIETDSRPNILEIVAEAAEAAEAADIVAEAEADEPTVDKMMRGATPEQRKEAKTSFDNLEREEKIIKSYEKYVAAHKEYYENDNYKKFTTSISSQGWGSKRAPISKKIEEFGTAEGERISKLIRK
jgi:hypothetical protein